MLTRPVLAALAVGIAGNEEDLARAALDRLDPIVRGLARRKLSRALLDAQLIAPGPPAHVMRIAALTLAGEPVPGDPSEVEAAYAQLPRWAMPRMPTWTLTTAVIAALVVGGGVLGVAMTRPHRSRVYHRPAVAESAEAFSGGGAPLHDPAIDTWMATELSHAIVELNDSIRAHRIAPGVLAQVRSPDAIAAHGEPLLAAWRGLIDQLADAGKACARGNPSEAEADQLRDAARAVSARLVDAGLGYVIDGRLDARFALLQLYRVDEVVQLRVGDTPRRVLSTHRADRINLRWAALGVHSHGIADPIVMAEPIHDFVTEEVFPVLAPDSPYPLGDDAWLRGDGHALAAACGTVVRAELAAALGRDADDATQIATKLAERGKLLDDWIDRATRNHLVMARPIDLFLPSGMLDQLDGFIPRYQLRRAEALDDDLAALDAARIASRLEDLVTTTVRRHEGRHGHDASLATPLRYPPALAAMLGPAADDAGAPVAIVAAARAELSAYLSQIANDPVTPQLSVWGLARHAFTPERAGTGEMFAAYVVLEGLARQLSAAPATGRGRARLVPLAQRIVAASGDQLRAAARALWTELYGEPLATITP